MLNRKTLEETDPYPPPPTNSAPLCANKSKLKWNNVFDPLCMLCGGLLSFVVCVSLSSLAPIFTKAS